MFNLELLFLLFPPSAPHHGPRKPQETLVNVCAAECRPLDRMGSSAAVVTV